MSESLHPFVPRMLVIGGMLAVDKAGTHYIHNLDVSPEHFVLAAERSSVRKK